MGKHCLLAVSLSIGGNGIQLTAAIGYVVHTTASPKNFVYVIRLAAIQTFNDRAGLRHPLMALFS